MTLAIRFSRAGALVAGAFLAAAAAVFAWIFFVASKNPADSGESGILLLPFAMPWITHVPTAWLSPWLALGCVLWNAFLLYCLFGGLRLVRSTS
jgi:hypothetical protein